MKTTKATTVMLVVFVLALGAGVIAGTLASRLPASSSGAVNPVDGASDRNASTLTQELQLNSQQREQMRSYWEIARHSAQDCLAQAESAQKDRDNAVFDLLTPEQKLQYDRLTKSCKQKIDALKAQREQAVREAVQRTQQILTQPQREAYDKMIKDRLGQMSLGLTEPSLAELQTNESPAGVN